jgi:hypothetical protein
VSCRGRIRHSLGGVAKSAATERGSSGAEEWRAIGLFGGPGRPEAGVGREEGRSGLGAPGTPRCVRGRDDDHKRNLVRIC